MDKYWGSKSSITAMVDNKDPFKIYIFSPLVFEKLTNYKKSDILPIIIHETAHAFITKINKRCFAWVNEGLCEYLSGDISLNNIVKRKNWLWFKNNEILNNPNISWRKIMEYEGYKISYNLVKYIVKKYKKDAIFKLLEIRRVKDKNIKEKINKILGGDFNKFLISFEKNLKLQ